MTMKDTIQIDIKENRILALHPRILSLLLLDQTTKKNIIWATDNYKQYGILYLANHSITENLITGANGNIIKPRIAKTKKEQADRIRDKAEVFTPLWICNAQNNLVDNAWFGKENVFNTEGDKCWTANENAIVFPNEKGKSWQDYVKATRMEITCGEAPYLASRYDTITGETVKVKDRIGLLDRKLRIVGENTKTEEEWLEWAIIAVKNIYGYEWQGDNLLIARENILYTFIEFFEDKFNKTPEVSVLLEVAEIISWNIWQMDGLKGVVPNSCTGEDTTQLSLYEEKKVCEGCQKNNMYKHIGTYCKIKDWETKRAIKFVNLLKGN